MTDHNDFLKERRLAPVENMCASRARTALELEGLLVKPLDYQPGKRYPTILRLHGGPVYQFSHEFMVEWQFYAAQGYAVVAPNPRGSSGRGFDFARAIYADWGNKDMQDVLAAVDHVVAMGVADPQRLGLGGRSYGGILTNYVIASDTRFKAAISGAGGSNMLGMYGHDEYTREYEFELGTPWNNSRCLCAGQLSLPACRPDQDADPVLLRRAGFQRSLPRLRADVPGAALARRANATGALSR